MSDSVSLTQHRTIVLLVDDQTIIGEAVRRMLTTEPDIDFHYCQDPTQAIKMANQIFPTVILQDLVMPEIEGLTLVRYFRANSVTHDVPLIVLSSKEEADTKAKAFALGANDYLVKLPDQLEVVARIRHHSKGYINQLERNEALKELAKANHVIRETFGRYLSDDIVNAILESPEGAAIGGEKRVVTIMMTDLRGFTSACERMPAESVVDILNIYLEMMTEIILKYQGTINEFMGDAIVVVFGAPILRDDDAQRAVACALEMQLAMAEVNQQCLEKEYPTVEQGIGINTGEVVVGNIGSKKRTKYDVIGHHVNLTSRIESYTVGGQIFISESTKNACSATLKIGTQMEVMPKGIRTPITVYEVKGICGDFNLFISTDSEVKLVTLQQPLSVQFTILSGKHTGENFCKGSLIKLNGKVAVIQAESKPSKLSNLKMSIFDNTGNEITNDLYAKMTDNISQSPPTFRVNFTSIPPEAKKFLEKILIANDS
jgi:adenylate cyclase